MDEISIEKRTERERERERERDFFLKIESFLEIIEEDETPRVAAPGDRINFEMVYFRRMWEEGRVPTPSSSIS